MINIQNATTGYPEFGVAIDNVNATGQARFKVDSNSTVGADSTGWITRWFTFNQVNYTWNEVNYTLNN